MKSAWPRIIAPNLFGEVAVVECPNQRPDLREAWTLQDEIAAEARITAEIRADPFKHLPFRFPTLAQIAKATAKNLKHYYPYWDAWRRDGAKVQP